MKSGVNNSGESGLVIDHLPREGLEKLNNFRNVFKIYFKSQVVAGEQLKVGQATVNRYLSGRYLVPIRVAQKISEISCGAIEVDEIYFDYKSYKYDMKMKEKEEKSIA